MSSRYWTPPSNLVPATIAHSGILNADMASIATAFNGPAPAVATDMALTLSHATLSITALTAVAGTMAGKYVAFDGTGLALTQGLAFGTWRGTWVTATNYNKGDVIVSPNYDASIYIAKVAYTSAAAFATDVSNNNLVLAIPLAPVLLPMPITAKSASFTAAVGNHYQVTTGSAEIDITLPNTASIGQAIRVVTIPGGTNAVFVGFGFSGTLNGITGVGPAGATIAPAADPVTRRATFTYSGSTYGWVITDR